jgi:predicted small lipoprotein YifL
LSSGSDLKLLRIAVIGALVATLGLVGCGRKGGLDPPPAAAVSEAQPPPGPALGRDGKPIAPATGPKRPFILDFLVD